MKKNMRDKSHYNNAKSEYIESVIEIDRVARTVKGGRRIRFRALVVVGDGKGKVSIGLGKAGDVSTAISKATTYAKRRLKPVKIINETIPYEIISRYGSAVVYLKPAPKGTSVIAGTTVRAIVEAAGIKNIVAKSLGSDNKMNNAKAVIEGLQKLNYLHDKYPAKAEDGAKKVSKSNKVAK